MSADKRHFVFETSEWQQYFLSIIIILRVVKLSVDHIILFYYRSNYDLS